MLQQGTGTGQARLSYAIIIPDVNLPLAPGVTSLVSVESPIDEIKNSVSTLTNTGTNTGTFSRCPDFITTTYYSNGYMKGQQYVETLHLQSSTLFRSLGLENDTQTAVVNAFGWGESLRDLSDQFDFKQLKPRRIRRFCHGEDKESPIMSEVDPNVWTRKRLI